MNKISFTKSAVTSLLIALVLTALLLTSVFADDNETALNVAALNGPTAMGLVELMEDARIGDENYAFEIFGTPDEVVAGLVGGKLDAAAVPCNLASVLYNKTEGKVRLAAINTLGVLYVVETGDSVQTVADLKGKTIYAVGKGATPEQVLRYVLSQNGIDPDQDVTIEYKSEAAEVAALMKEAGESVIALLPQPFVTSVSMQNDKIRVALDMTREWNAVSGGNELLMGCFVVRAEVIESHREVVDEFLDNYEDSVEFVHEHPAEAARFIESFGILPKAAIAEKALPACNITYIEGERMKTLIEAYLPVLLESNPQSIGGKLPAEDFYYFPLED